MMDKTERKRIQEQVRNTTQKVTAARVAMNRETVGSSKWKRKKQQWENWKKKLDSYQGRLNAYRDSLAEKQNP